MTYDTAFIAKVFPMLAEAFDTTLSSIFGGRLYESVGPAKPTFPECIYQSQDGGGKRDDYIGQNGWQGLITFRSIDTTLSGARNNTIQLLDALPSLTASGYSILTIPEKPQWFPVETLSTGRVYTAGVVVRFFVQKT